MNNVYNPDILNCLANLSSDEVFTPPNVAKDMLDMLPQEIWKNKNITFLDPACKSGVFLREIAKRLLDGLKDEIPDLQERINHIYKKQLFGISITTLTGLVSRRSLYCSKFPNKKYSVCQFDNEQGNIKFNIMQHTWEDNKCKFCGAAKQEYDRDKSLETYAYEFIHTENPKEIFNMKFDVIIGNPPYHFKLGNKSGNSAKSRAIYHLFVSNAIKLQPKYLCMIMPSRWMTRTAEGIPEKWIDDMLNCNKFKIIHDFEDESQCFSNNEIKGGVHYFLWQRNYNGKCQYYFHPLHSSKIQVRNDYLALKNIDIIIREPNDYELIKKISKIEGEYYAYPTKNFSGLVSPKDFFTNKQLLTSSWNEYSKTKTNKAYIKYYLNKQLDNEKIGWVALEQIPKNQNSININKIYIPAAAGTGKDNQILGKPFIGEKNSVCSQTYLVIGYDPIHHNFTEDTLNNIITYIYTKFFRYLVSIKKKTQNGPRGVYQFVPIQDFTKPWTDEKLYKKYNLSDEEIKYIEDMIKPMNSGE